MPIDLATPDEGPRFLGINPCSQDFRIQLQFIPPTIDQGDEGFYFSAIIRFVELLSCLLAQDRKVMIFTQMLPQALYFSGLGFHHFSPERPEDPRLIQEMFDPLTPLVKVFHSGIAIRGVKPCAPLLENSF